MFVGASDVPRGLAVLLMSGRTNSDADYQAYIDTMLEVIAQSPHPMVAAVMLIDPGNPVPNATWRRRIAHATHDIPSSALFAVASSSRMIQSVITAINWLRSPVFQWSVHSEFNQAHAWIEEKRGESCPEFTTLLARARAEAHMREKQSR